VLPFANMSGAPEQEYFVDGVVAFSAARYNQPPALEPSKAPAAIIDHQQPRTAFDPKGTLGTGSAGLAVGGPYLAVAAGIDHLVAELGVARQDAPVDRAGGGDDLAVAAQ
jgi:hypothetical protein